MPFPVCGQLQISMKPRPLSRFPVPHGAWFEIKAPKSNQGPVFLGPPGVSAQTGHHLDPGDVLRVQRSDQAGQPRVQVNVHEIFGVAESDGDRVTWMVVS